MPNYITKTFMSFHLVRSPEARYIARYHAPASEIDEQIHT